MKVWCWHDSNRYFKYLLLKFSLQHAFLPYPLHHKLPHNLVNYAYFFAIALCWGNILLNAAAVFCIVLGRSILLAGHCMLQIFWLSIIFCKDKELNTGLYNANSIALQNFKTTYFLWGTHIFAGKKGSKVINLVARIHQQVEWWGVKIYGKAKLCSGQS